MTTMNELTPEVLQILEKVEAEMVNIVPCGVQFASILCFPPSLYKIRHPIQAISSMDPKQLAMLIDVMNVSNLKRYRTKMHKRKPWN